LPGLDGPLDGDGNVDMSFDRIVGFDRPDHDDDMFDADDEGECPHNKRGHSFVTEDVDRGEGRSYCQWCNADGDA
jgi:hypothetical protein